LRGALFALTLLSCVTTRGPQNSGGSGSGNASGAVYADPDRPAEERAADLVSRMTLAEKIGQMGTDAPAIPRLGVPAYHWWNEALHGVARAGTATVFPQAIALAASFDEALVRQVATAIADEARAKHHEALRRGQHGRYQGLTFFSPNVNILRDPRWGRGQETYGEDPLLTGRVATAFIQGMQGTDARYLKTAATAKHFAVHSGPEALRHGFDARVSPHDLADTYLPQFEAAVRDGQVASVMSAYNRVNGVPCSADPDLLERTLRGEWGFRGYVVSDCGAIDDIYRQHRAAASAEQAAALSVRAGTDLACGDSYGALGRAVARGLIDTSAIDRAVRRLFEVRFRLGMFDPPARVPFSAIPFSVVDSPAHRALAKQAAQKAIVLLENRGGALPLGAGVRRIAVVGPTAADREVLLGNYHGKPSTAVTILDGLRDKARARNVAVEYARGVSLTGRSSAEIGDAVAAARRSDVVLAVVGLSPRLEGEEDDAAANPGGDRHDLALPGAQERLLEAVVAAGKPVVVVLTGGGAVAVPWAAAHAAALLQVWYPGEEGGTAVADVLFGDANPAGRLPITIYRSVADLPPFADYSMRGRTYRYLDREPLYRFGAGLSYTRFRYGAPSLVPAPADAGGRINVSVEVENTGSRAGDEVVQLYVLPRAAPPYAPRRWLADFARVSLAAGERRTIGFFLRARALEMVDEAGRRQLVPGQVTLAIGGGQPDRDGRYASPEQGVTLELRPP
jgi:beta-glucosidase